MTKLIDLVGTLLLLASTSIWVNCDVDHSSPDLDIFRLNHVNAKQFSRQRADEPIEQLATGAQFMRESLYLNDFQVRCISYTHLLKLIENRQPQQKQINQNVVQALAVVADVDRALYLDMLKFHQYAVAPRLFMRAIKQLEGMIDSNNVALDTWHDLIKCLSAYFYGIDHFLKEPRRAQILLEFDKFKALPANLDQWEAEGRLKPKVGRLVRKYDGQEPLLMPFDESEVNEARALIESFDDDGMSLLRPKAQQDPSTGRRHDIPPINNATNDHQKSPSPACGEEIVKGIKVVVTVLDDADIQVSYGPDVYSPAQTKILHAVRTRLLTLLFTKRLLSTRPDANGPKLSINLALDFVTHWNDLRDIQNGSSNQELVRILSQFLDSKENQAVYSRLSKTYNNYKSAVDRLMQLETKRVSKKFATMEELEETYAKTFEAFNMIDEAFDVYDIGRALQLGKMKELKEFKTVNRFVTGDFHW